MHETAASRQAGREGLTQACGRFASGFDAVTPLAAQRAVMGIADAVGVMLAAAREPEVRAARAIAGDGAPQGRASLLLSGECTRAADAAFVNATAAHAFAMDDVAAGCHPSAMLMPALLAVGETMDASGAEVLRAYVVGFEMLAELAARQLEALHAGGWHPTGVLGPVAVAAAVARLMNLPAPMCAQAVGIAASFSGGLQANFGSRTKALHAGRAASAGVQAAQLAQQGITASAVALEHPKGLLHTVARDGRVDIDSPAFADGRLLHIDVQGPSIKKYPLCYALHRLVDAAIDIAGQEGFDATRVQRIGVHVGRRQAAMAPHAAPQTPLQARYSVQFAVAAGLVARAAGFAQLAPDFVASAPVRALMAATDIQLRDGSSADDPVFSETDRVVVQQSDGRLFDSGEVRYARGHTRAPLSPQALWRKFEDCLRSSGHAHAEPLYAALTQLPSLPSVRALSAAARGKWPEGVDENSISRGTL
jgi:2-methylcitrate dehydratase PrpD